MTNSGDPHPPGTLSWVIPSEDKLVLHLRCEDFRFPCLWVLGGPQGRRLRDRLPDHPEPWGRGCQGWKGPGEGPAYPLAIVPGRETEAQRGHKGRIGSAASTLCSRTPWKPADDS